jgi:hypothetical protein
MAQVVPKLVPARAAARHQFQKLFRRRSHELEEARLIELHDLRMLLLDLGRRARQLAADPRPHNQIIGRPLLAIDNRPALFGDDRLHRLELVFPVAKLPHERHALPRQLLHFGG